MKRRSFLGIVAAALAAPTSLLKGKCDCDESVVPEDFTITFDDGTQFCGQCFPMVVHLDDIVDQMGRTIRGFTFTRKPNGLYHCEIEYGTSVPMYMIDTEGTRVELGRQMLPRERPGPKVIMDNVDLK